MGLTVLRHRRVGKHEKQDRGQQRRVEGLGENGGQQRVHVRRVGALDVVQGDIHEPVQNGRTKYHPGLDRGIVRNKTPGRRAHEIPHDNETEHVVAQRGVRRYVLEDPAQEPGEHRPFFALSNPEIHHEHQHKLRNDALNPERIRPPRLDKHRDHDQYRPQNVRSHRSTSFLKSTRAARRLRRTALLNRLHVHQVRGAFWRSTRHHFVGEFLPFQTRAEQHEHLVDSKGIGRGQHLRRL